MKKFFKWLLIIIAVIGLPLIAFVVYLTVTLSSQDKNATAFASQALTQIAQTFDPKNFLNAATDQYTVALDAPKGANAANTGHDTIIIGGGTPDLVKQTFEQARSRLGDYRGIARGPFGSVTCKNAFGLIMCFGSFEYTHGQAIFFATLQKVDSTYKIQELKIAPIQ